MQFNMKPPYNPPMNDDIMRIPTEMRPEIPTAASDLITALGKRNLTGEAIARLKLLIPNTTLDIHYEIEMQHEIVKSMQSRILDENNQLHENASAKEIATVITGFNSYLNLYLRSMEKIDRDKQSQEIETAVLEAINDMPNEAQEHFFSKLKKRLEI